MEHHVQQPYRDSPLSSRSSSPMPNAGSPAAKPLPSLPREASPASAAPEPYRDDPAASREALVPMPRAPTPHRYRAASAPQTHVPFAPYTDLVPEDNDDVPLAHLYPYPTEAPPPYYVAVQTSLRGTLIHHIPAPTMVEQDEEAAIGRPRMHDANHAMERVICMFILAFALLLVAAVLAWQVFITMSQ